MRRYHRFLPLLCLPALMFLGGCSVTGAATGAGAAVGVAAVQEGGISRAYDDAKIQAHINKLWLEYDFDTFRKLDLTVDHGRVLITGVVQNPEARVEAVRLAWQPEGVKQVLNEIRIADERKFTSFARDAWISTKLRTSLTFDSSVQSVNYSIDTVEGNVYLLGVAQNQTELNRVMEVARTISDVKQVVSYVRILGESVIEAQPPQGQPMLQPPQEYQQPPVQQQQQPYYNAPMANLPPEQIAPASGGAYPVNNTYPANTYPAVNNGARVQQDTGHIEVYPLDPPPNNDGQYQGNSGTLTPNDRVNNAPVPVTQQQWQ